VSAVGVNYADVCVRMGLYKSAKEFVGWPITPGFEVFISNQIIYSRKIDQMLICIFE